MKDANIKKLAKITAQEGRVDFETRDFVLNLSRKNLSSYLRHLRALIDKETVRISSQQEIPNPLKKKISEQFSGKRIIYENAPIGDGIKLQINDTIIDLTLRGLVDQAIEKLNN